MKSKKMTISYPIEMVVELERVDENTFVVKVNGRKLHPADTFVVLKGETLTIEMPIAVQ